MNCNACVKPHGDSCSACRHCETGILPVVVYVTFVFATTAWCVSGNDRNSDEKWPTLVQIQCLGTILIVDVPCNLFDAFWGSSYFHQCQNVSFCFNLKKGSWKVNSVLCVQTTKRLCKLALNCWVVAACTWIDALAELEMSNGFLVFFVQLAFI